MKTSINPNVFSDPPALYRPGYFWLLNGKLDSDTLVAQLREMAALGAKSVCPHPIPPEFRPDSHSTMTPEYLSDAYFRALEPVLDEAEKLGVNWLLYDEGGWPSGSACGQVWASDPEHFTRLFLISDGGGGVKVVHEENCPAESAPIPDLLHSGVAQKFIELTHERYRHFFGRHFGKTIRVVFTDEPAYLPPGPGRLAWTVDFAAEFRRRQGYDIEPWLPRLLDYQTRFRDESTRVRIDYYDTLAQLFTERFLLPVRDWCRRHGLIFGGHFGGEDEPRICSSLGYGHLLRSLRALDMPGVDVIWRQLYPEIRRHPFPKYASSIANQAGHKLVLGEIFAIYGTGLTPNVMKWIIDYLLVRGVNSFIASCIHQNHSKGAMSGRGFGPINPLWKYFRHFHDYAGRAAYLLTRGRPVVDTAVYFDIRSLWCGGDTADNADSWHWDISLELLQRRCGFDYLDDDALMTAEIVGCKLHVGVMAYETVVLPFHSELAAGVAEKLAAFQAAGGRVRTPDELDQCPALIKIVPETDKLRVCKRKIGGTALYFIVNESSIPVSVSLEIPEKKALVRCDPESGKFYLVQSSDGRWRWNFAPFGSAFFLAGDQPAISEARPGHRSQPLSGNWELCPLRQYTVGKDNYENCFCAADFQPVELGDWRKYLGSEFSGDAVYRLEFDCNNPGAFRFLDLGEVNYSASVKLNGRELGDRLWGPFHFVLADMLQQKNNVLEIMVTNTLANAISPDRVRKYWAVAFPPESRYEPIMRGFEQDSLCAGLVGPVRLLE